MPWYTTADAHRDAERQALEESKRGVCANCPFRADSELGYDADAIEALNEGHDPSCHAVVGLDAIFVDAPNHQTRCLGFVKWLNRTPGFRKPKFVK